MSSNYLAENIRCLRKGARMSQEELGSLIGVSAMAVSRWERDCSPTVPQLLQLGKVFCVSLDDLVYRPMKEVK